MATNGAFDAIKRAKYFIIEKNSVRYSLEKTQDTAYTRRFKYRMVGYFMRFIVESAAKLLVEA